MTREEAIQILRDTPIDIRSTREDDIHTLYATAQMMAIEALQADRHEELTQIANTRKAVEYIVQYERQEADNPKDKCDLCRHAIVGTVVRCKDCKHWQKTNIETIDGEPTYDCPFCGEWADANGFCSFGERREP